MANTKSTTYLTVGDKHTVIYFTLAYVDAQESGTVLYDSSVVCAALGIRDPLNCVINSIKALVRSPAGLIRLDFDASTDVLAVPFPTLNGNQIELCFEREGGLKNYAGTGRTGDILLTTTGLAAGDLIMIVLDVRPS